MRRNKLFRTVFAIISISFIWSVVFGRKRIYPSVPPQALSNISYDHRSFIINGKRELLIVGAIHYPRSSTGMWPHLFKKTKEAGINAIDTYVFWNLHEPTEGHYDFETGELLDILAVGYANLPLFLKLAQDHGLYVILRIGPYVCAEWNLGGLPSWLLGKPGIFFKIKKGMVFRTWNAPFMKAMETFVRKSVDVVRPYLASSGGPIIAMQIENEYGNVQKEYGINGDKYIVWAADLANSLDTGIPWFMCQQDNINTILLTCNGFYCHDWINKHWKNAYNTPPMFTELWTGWFQHWATPKLIRPAEDLAFSVALWFANGGSFLTYYMWHGGTNLYVIAILNISERWGSDFKTTSYDYDSPLNEYGFETKKYYHLARLHAVLNDNAEIILSNDPKKIRFGYNQNAYIFGNLDSSNVLVFLINSDTKNDAPMNLNGQQFTIPKWTATLLEKGVDGRLSEVFSSSSVAPHSTTYSNRDPSLSPAILKVPRNSIKWIREPAGIWEESLSHTFNRPAEQIRFTHDETDYLWYERRNLDVSLGGDETVRVTIRPPTDLVYVYINGKLAHTEEVAVMNVDMDQHGEKSHDIVTKVIISASKFPQESFNLSILSVTMGLLNYGAFYDKVEKGLYGSIMINNHDITDGDWLHQIGLQGEYKRYYNHPNIHKWNSILTKAIYVPLVWYKITITHHQIEKLIGQRYHSSNTLVSFALYLGSMGKGYAWVTTEEGRSNSIGRYWDINSDYNECPNCDWVGSFFATKCPINCSGPSQSYYHIPRDWVIGESAYFSFDIVLFEERGGDPSGVQLMLLN